MKNELLFLALILLLSSCNQDDRVKFSEPQPRKIKAVTHFKNSFTGNYKNVSKNNESIRIEKQQIIQTTRFLFTVNRNTVEISDRAHVDRNNDSSLIAYFEKLGGEAHIQGDSITYTSDWVDTLFKISKTKILKYYRRSYYLNFQSQDSLWSVRKLKISGDTLLIWKISPSDTLLRYDYTQVDSLNTSEDSKAFILDPSKRESKKLMRSDLFTITKKYIKE